MPAPTDRLEDSSLLPLPPWPEGEPPPAVLRIVEAFRSLDASDMPPATRALWEDARQAALELAVLHLTALGVAELAHGLVEAHTEREEAQRAGDAVEIASKASDVLGIKAALQGALDSLREATEPREIDF